MTLLAVTTAGCAGDRRATEPNAAARPGRAADNVAPVDGAAATTAPPAPGEFTVTLPARGAYAEDSLRFEGNPAYTFAESTLVKVTGRGTITRIWRSMAWSVQRGMAGTSYFPLDAAGDWGGSWCPGATAAYFFHPTAGWSGRELCVNRPIDAPRGGPHERIQTVWGWAMIHRSRAREPVVNGQYECGPLNLGPCLAYAGSTEITVTPWRQFLTVTATPANIVEGDTVQFVASAAPHSITVRRWIWVPDQPSPPLALRASETTEELSSAAAMTSTAACGVQPQCRIPVFERGTMYVQARVNAPGQRRVEQAGVGVVVDSLVLTLQCTPNGLPRDYATTCTAGTQPVQRAVAPESWRFEPDSAAIGVVERTADVSSVVWNGKVVTSGIVRVRAVVAGRSRDAQTRLTALRRPEWDSMVLPTTGEDISPHPAVSIPKEMHQLGQTVFEATVIANAIGWVTDDGPNHEYYFHKSIPAHVLVRYGVNTLALARGTAFYQHQFGATDTTIAGVRWCGRSSIDRMREAVYQHEGRSRSEQYSHYQTFTDRFERDARRDGESPVWMSNGPAERLRNTWLDSALAESVRITDDTVTSPPWSIRQRLGCNIRLF